MSKKNILAEAIADSKALKMAAVQNAQALILENMKADIKEMVEDQMNEMADADLNENEECAPEEEDEDLSEGNEMAVNESEDLELAEFGDEEESDEEGEFEGDDLGITESDLQEALAAALNEVEHGPMGDLEQIDPDSHDTGLMDQDTKEAGWDEKTAPAKKDFTVKEYKNRIAKLVTENTMLKKANAQLKRTVNEVQLFNVKLHYAHRLLQKEGLAQNTKKQIVAKMDEVKSIAEAKTLYESLELALGALSENKKTKRSTSLSESLGLRETSNGRGISEVKTPHLQEPNPFDPARLKKLAGVK